MHVTPFRCDAFRNLQTAHIVADILDIVQQKHLAVYAVGLVAKIIDKNATNDVRSKASYDVGSGGCVFQCFTDVYTHERCVMGRM